MKSFPTIIVAAAALLLIVGLGVVYFFSLPPDAVEENTKNPFSFTLPLSSSKENQTPATNGVPTTEESGTLEVRTAVGGTRLVDDFTKSPDVVADSYGLSFYLLFPIGTTTASAPDLEYEIAYLISSRSFLIVIAKEPIAEVRRRATDDLGERIGLSGKDLCSLAVEVQTPRWVNIDYADKNLGLPGCPGAVKFAGDPAF